ncbi:MAG TPA: peptidoglycan-binding domain-containing protein, partial [Bacillota bacterium]|nr:peptidoglycan-binding domain-containing protein [Bacillota bacterium]
MSKRMTTRVILFVLIALLFSSQVFASTSLLRVGSRGIAVSNLQTKLNELNFNAGAADGIFGSGTRAAVIRFQKANGLAADGIAGSATMAKLNGSTTTEPTKPSKPSPQPPTTGGQAPITQTLRQGSRNGQVKTLQQKLNELGFNAGGADGIFGSGTRAAVI